MGKNMNIVFFQPLNLTCIYVNFSPVFAPQLTLFPPYVLQPLMSLVPSRQDSKSDYLCLPQSLSHKHTQHTTYAHKHTEILKIDGDFFVLLPTQPDRPNHDLKPSRSLSAVLLIVFPLTLSTYTPSHAHQHALMRAEFPACFSAISVESHCEALTYSHTHTQCGTSVLSTCVCCSHVLGENSTDILSAVPSQSFSYIHMSDRYSLSLTALGLTEIVFFV